MAPTASAGVKAVMGNRKPVRVVSTVVARKIAVRPGSSRPPTMASATTMPVTMAIRLMTTWTCVNVSNDMPRIMAPPY